jgi:acyl-coenzyme A synthetase/AMP-(fatty) acid ligase
MYFFRDDLPRNANGKIDMLALKAMAVRAQQRGTDVNAAN